MTSITWVNHIFSEVNIQFSMISCWSSKDSCRCHLMKNHVSALNIYWLCTFCDTDVIEDIIVTVRNSQLLNKIFWEYDEPWEHHLLSHLLSLREHDVLSQASLATHESLQISFTSYLSWSWMRNLTLLTWFLLNWLQFIKITQIH